VPAAPIAPCAKNKAHERSRYRSTGITRHSRTRLVLTAYFVLSPAIGLSCHRHQRDAVGIIADLTPASRRQDHTTWPSANGALRLTHRSVHRIPLRVRDDRDTPLHWSETAALMK
jgi:hypothetical protein